MANQKKNKINKELKKEKIGKWAVGVSAVLFSFVLIWFLFFQEKNDFSYKAAENYYNFENGKAEFQRTIDGKKSPYILLYSFKKYKETKDIKYIKDVIDGNFSFYSDMARIIFVDHLIGEEKIKDAEKVLSSVREKEFLAIKYYFSGLVNEKQNELDKARDYYKLVIDFEGADVFLKELSSLRVSFLR